MKLEVDSPAVTGRPFIGLACEIATAILHIVEAGWRLAVKSPDVNARAREVTITTRLHSGMRQAVDDTPEWKGEIAVLRGTESYSRSDIAVPDGLTDISIFVIRIFQRFREHDPHAIIECKRIAENDARLCREYVVEGIDRFQSGKYAGNHLVGFMIGYLIAGDAEAAVTGINRYLNRKSRSAEDLGPSNVVDKPWAW